MPRVFAASSTFTVPPMLTAVPYGGSALMLRNEQRGEMDDVRDAVVVEDLVEASRSMMSPLHERDLGFGGESDPPVVGAEVEADDLGAFGGELARTSTRRCSRARR